MATEGARRLRAFWNWHEQPWLIAKAATPAGRVILVAVVAALVPTQTALVIVPSLALFAVFPRYRVEILAVGSMAILVRRFAPGVHVAGLLSAIVVTVALVALVYLVYLAAREFRRFPDVIQRAPQLWLHAALLGFVALFTTGPYLGGISPRQGPWLITTSVAMALPFLLWRASYIVQAGTRGTARSSRFVDHLVYAFPAWGGTNVPYGKGYDYLAKRGVDGAEPIAAVQLAGIKLLVLALLWQKVGALLMVVVHDQPAPAYARVLGDVSLGWPSLGALIAAGPGAAPLAVRWSVVGIELIEATLHLAVTGHLIIGVLRLFGFRVFRNTYKPLLATSIVEFWNRFYYYFKELLVEFFFFPTYLRWFKGRPQLRIFAAVMVSVLVGNLYFHVVRDLREYAGRDLVDAASMLASRGFYCLLLAVGIYVSMLHEQERRGRTAEATRWPQLIALRRIGGVWLFYGLVHIWNVGPLDLTFGQRTALFLGLFGIE